MIPRPRAFDVASLLVLLLAVGCIVATYGVLSHTVDEPVQVVTGLEWFEFGTHWLKPENPTIGQALCGIGAWLDGQHVPPEGTVYQRGTELLYAGGHYHRNLLAARISQLPFFVLAAFVVWRWARRCGGPRAAFIALAAFVTVPPVLGHAGLATLDVGAVGTLLLALDSFVRWLGAPTAGRAAWAGATLALAVTVKFSALVFFPPCALLIVVAHRLLAAEAGDRVALRRQVLGAALLVTVAALSVWAAYRFSVGRVVDAPGGEQLVGRCFPDEDSAARHLAERVARARIPAPDFVLGLFALYDHVKVGHNAYLLGRTSQHGFWYYYPVALAVKTPPAFALIVLAGVLAIALSSLRRQWLVVIPPLAAALVLAAAMRSTINIGVRHVLVVYPLLAIAAGIGIDALLRWASGRRRILAGVATASLLGWQVLLPPIVHPDHLAYFNVLAGDEPGEVLLDSDLDWGQDVFRLERYLQDKNVDLLHIAYFGSVRLCEHGLPPVRWLPPNQPVRGWVAISEMYYRSQWHFHYDDACDRTRPRIQRVRDGYAWLREHRPIARIGKSIRVYHIE